MRERKENRINYPKLIFYIVVLALIIFAVIKVFGIIQSNNKMSKQENMSHKMCFIDETETEESTQFGVESHQPNSYNPKQYLI